MILIIDCGTEWLKEIEVNVEKAGYSFKSIKFDKLNGFDFSLFSGVIISGAPTLLTEVDLEKYLEFFKFIKTINVPVLGICIGHQIMGLLYGSKITNSEMIDKKEVIDILNNDPIFENIADKSLFREEHSEHITLPDEFKLLAKSNTCDNEVMKHNSKTLYGTQFHPEVSDEVGTTLFKNFLKMCSN